MSLIADALIAARRENASAIDKPLIDDAARSDEYPERPRRGAYVAGGIAMASLVILVGFALHGFGMQSAGAVAASGVAEPTITLQSKSEASSERPTQQAAELPVPTRVAPSVSAFSRRPASRHTSVAATPRQPTIDSIASGPKAVSARIDSPRAVADSLFRVAYAEQMSGNLEGAKGLYERSIATGRASAAALNDYGALLLVRGDRSGAAAMFRGALNRDDRSVEAWVNLGDIFSAADHRSEAMSAYSRANRLDPARVAVRLRLAREFEAIGDLVTARRYLDGAIDPSANGDSVLTEARRRIERLTRAP